MHSLFARVFSVIYIRLPLSDFLHKFHMEFVRCTRKWNLSVSEIYASSFRDNSNDFANFILIELDLDWNMHAMGHGMAQLSDGRSITNTWTASPKIFESPTIVFNKFQIIKSTRLLLNDYRFINLIKSIITQHT